jgi:hypothetical protein
VRDSFSTVVQHTGVAVVQVYELHCLKIVFERMANYDSIAVNVLQQLNLVMVNSVFMFNKRIVLRGGGGGGV